VPESAVGVSSDEVMLDKNLQPITAERRYPDQQQPDDVGNNVRLDAFGLKARLTGDLWRRTTGAGPNGQINIPEGRFHAYGQDLIVRKGELLFSGPPDQPLLNIEAIRNPDATERRRDRRRRVTGSPIAESGDLLRPGDVAGSALTCCGQVGQRTER
jgi:translocation and assembly module TamB